MCRPSNASIIGNGMIIWPFCVRYLVTMHVTFYCGMWQLFFIDRNV